LEEPKHFEKENLYLTLDRSRLAAASAAAPQRIFRDIT
jgi:hypothetical protein